MDLEVCHVRNLARTQGRAVWVRGSESVQCITTDRQTGRLTD